MEDVTVFIRDISVPLIIAFICFFGHSLYESVRQTWIRKKRRRLEEKRVWNDRLYNVEKGVQLLLKSDMSRYYHFYVPLGRVNTTAKELFNDEYAVYTRVKGTKGTFKKRYDDFMRLPEVDDMPHPQSRLRPPSEDSTTPSQREGDENDTTQKEIIDFSDDRPRRKKK